MVSDSDRIYHVILVHLTCRDFLALLHYPACHLFLYRLAVLVVLVVKCLVDQLLHHYLEVQEALQVQVGLGCRKLRLSVLVLLVVLYDQQAQYILVAQVDLADQVDLVGLQPTHQHFGLEILVGPLAQVDQAIQVGQVGSRSRNQSHLENDLIKSLHPVAHPAQVHHPFLKYIDDFLICWEFDFQFNLM